MEVDQVSSPGHLTRSDHDLAERTAMIETTRWTDGFTHSQLETLARYMESFEVDEGRTILAEGGRDGHMLLIVSGKLNVVKSDGHGDPKIIATIGPGRTFGEMSLFDGEPRSASAVAASKVTFLLLSRESFERLIEMFPTLGVAIYAKLAKLLSQRLRQTTGRLIDHL